MSTAPLPMSSLSRRIAGILLLIMVTVEFGGYFLVQVVNGNVKQTQFQNDFGRAGHAHAAVLLVLSLVCLLLADGAGLRGFLGYLGRLAIPTAAVLMSAGFFLSSVGQDRTQPNALIVLLWLGVLALTIGVVCLGIALLRATPQPTANPTQINTNPMTSSQDRMP